jgi:transcriptional regulator of arginine metabolism
MTDTRARRQKLIAEMIRSGTVSSQEDVTAKLAEQGIAVTQATVSRDLDQLGAVKVKRGGVLGYALPDQMADSDWAASRLQRILADWVQSASCRPRPRPGELARSRRHHLRRRYALPRAP